VDGHVKQRIEAVQKMFLALVAASVLVALLGLPLGNDAQLTAVVEELSLFSRAFDQKKLEQTLLGMAQVQNRVTVGDVLSKLEGEGLPKVKASDKGAAIASLAALDLTTLEAVHRHSADDASLDVAAVKPETVAVGLSWRIARLGADKPVTVKAIELLRADVSEEQTKREREIFDARQAMLVAAKAHVAAEAAHEASDESYRARVKWGGHWKVINRANEKRQEARVEANKRGKDKDATAKRYAQLEKQGLAFKAGGSTGATPSLAAASVTLQVGGGKTTTVVIPVPLDVRTVKVPPLSGTEFTRAHETGMWEGIKGMEPEEALKDLSGRFSWHKGAVGAGLLHSLPLALPLLLLLLVIRIRVVSDGYSPFAADGQGGLPRVGIGIPAVDALLVGAMPTVACAMCAWSLLAVAQVPTVPTVAAAVSMGLGAWSFPHLRELRAMTDNIVRSRTAPPPPGAVRDS